MATTSVSRSGELGLGFVDPRLIDGFRALWDAMVRITTIETCSNVVLSRNIPFLRHSQHFDHIVGLLTQLLEITQTRLVVECSKSMKLPQVLTDQQMTKSLPENGNRALSESFKKLYGALTREGRYFGQSLSNGNNLLCGNTDILIRDFGNAIFGKVFKETLEGCNYSVADGKHFIERKLDICYTTLFVKGQVLKLLVNSFNK
jgi:hypothetical protein